MSMINKFKMIFAAYTIILAYCVFFSHNAYINAALICGGFIMSILASGYVFGTSKGNESDLLGNMANTFFEDL